MNKGGDEKGGNRSEGQERRRRRRCIKVTKRNKPHNDTERR